MTSPLVFKGMNAAHRVLLKVTFGKVGWSTGSMKVLELTTESFTPLEKVDPKEFATDD